MGDAPAKTTIVHVTLLHRADDVRIYHKECLTLVRAGYDVHLFAPDAPDTTGPVVFHNIPPVTSRFASIRMAKRLWVVWNMACRLEACIWHFHDTELLPVAIALKLTGRNVIYDVHEDAPQDALSIAVGRPIAGRVIFLGRKFCELAAKRLLDGFVCATPSILKRFPPQRSVLVRNYPIPEKFEPNASTRPYRDRANVVVYTGGVTRYRGLEQMLAAMDLLPAELDARLIVAGQFGRGIKDQVHALPGADRVAFHGWQGWEAIADMLSQARVGLVVLQPRPEYRDSLPVKLFEYMAAGIPVIASDFPQWRQIVGPAACGLLVDPMDPAAIAEAIRFFLSNPTEAERMGRNGRQAVEQHYKWQTEAQELLGLCRRLCPSPA